VKRLVALLLALLTVGPVSAAPAPARAPLTWNADRVANADGSVTAEVHGKWVNYLNGSGSWEAIDTTLTKTGSGFAMTKAPFSFRAPLTADGEAYFESNSRFDALSGTVLHAAPMGMWMTALDAQPVAGIAFDMDGTGRPDAVIYPDAFPQWGADLVYYVQHGSEPRLQKLVRFRSVLSQDVDPRFLLRLSGPADVRPRQPGKKYGSGGVVTDRGVALKRRNSKRGIGLSDPAIWDSNGKDAKKEPIDITLQPFAGGMLLTKHVPAAFFSGAVLPVYTDTTVTFSPDADPETSTFDGRVASYGAFTTWAGAHDATSGTVSITGDTNTIVTTTAQEASGKYYIIRSILLFNTGPTVPAGATITSATLSLVPDTIFDGDPSGAQSYAAVVGSSNPASNTAISVNDYPNCGSTTMSNQIDLGSLTVGTAKVFTLNASGIAAIAKGSGLTKLGLKDGHDIENVSIGVGVQSGSDFRSADYTGTANDPVLSVTYTLTSSTPAKPRTISVF
jgi:hypothetical protein